MSRQSRIFIEGLSVHVIQRGLNSMTIFQRNADYQVFLAVLRMAALNRCVAVHGYVCMTTHVHIIVTPSAPGSLPRMMKEVDSGYVRYYNRLYKRTGTLWNGRYRSFSIDTDSYWLTCLRYVEQNPLRAGMVPSPEAYRWSSYPAHAFGHEPSWLTPHPVYQALGTTPEKRQLAYRALCGSSLTDEEVALVRQRLIGVRSVSDLSATCVGAVSAPSAIGVRLVSDTAPNAV